MKRRQLVGVLGVGVSCGITGCSNPFQSSIEEDPDTFIVPGTFFNGLRKTSEGGMNEDYYLSGYGDYAEALYNQTGEYKPDNTDDHYVVHFVLDYGEKGEAKEQMGNWNNWLRENKGDVETLDVGAEGYLAVGEFNINSMALYRGAQMIFGFDEVNREGSLSASEYASRHFDQFVKGKTGFELPI